MLSGKCVILGVTGSIAAYKTASLASMLKKQNSVGAIPPLILKAVVKLQNMRKGIGKELIPRLRKYTKVLKIIWKRNVLLQKYKSLFLIGKIILQNISITALMKFWQDLVRCMFATADLPKVLINTVKD